MFTFFKELLSAVKDVWANRNNEVKFSDSIEKEIKDNAIEVERNLNDPKYEAE